jgi:hypothetical protein
MGGAFCAALGVGFVALAFLGTGQQGVSVATESVARVAFVFFWLAYAGGALATFFGSASDGLARHRREFGLAFAAALLVHLAFVAWLFRISFPQPVSDTVVLYFGIGALWTYGLALGSIKCLHDLLGANLWRIFSFAGVEYIAFLFFRDFILVPLQYGAEHPFNYVPFSILIIVGPLLRWASITRRYYLHWRAQHPAATKDTDATAFRQKSGNSV